VFHKKAKTTKKIVLRLQCAECKGSSMKPIKVGAGGWAGAACVVCCGLLKAELLFPWTAACSAATNQLTHQPPPP
jgi:hypothetical protein